MTATTGITAAVVWKVVSTAAKYTGDLGSVTSKGVYTAPAAIPTPATVLIQAQDLTNSALLASAAVALTNPVPAISALTPAAINTGLAYKVVVTGTGFLASSQVMWSGKAVASHFVSATEIDLAGTSVLPTGSVAVTVVNPDPGTATSNARNLSVEAAVAVQASPDKKTIRLDQTQTFTSHVSNNTDQEVAWQVNGKTGGSATQGLIDDKGVYTAPLLLPSPATVTITAISHADPLAKASVSLILENAVPAIKSVSPSTVTAAAAAAMVQNTMASPGATDVSTAPSGPVTMTVNGTGFAQGAAIYFAGVKLSTTFVSDKQLTTTSSFAIPMGRIAAVKVVNPIPGGGTSPVVAVPVKAAAEKMSVPDAVRFLRMATWGPTTDSVAHLQLVGRDQWLAEQFASRAAAWPDPLDTNEGMGRLQDAFFTNAITGTDQLRQRVAFALAGILVSSGVKDSKFDQMVGYQRLLGDDAFGNFRTLLGTMTLNPAMGVFLDMVNNDKANPTKNTVANENYAREVMQLFTLGLVQLDATGTPIPGTAPEYDQTTVTEMAKVFTGWTFAPQPGFAGHWTNPEYYFAPMVAYQEHHDITQKNVNLPLPCTIAAGGSAAADLNAALDCIVKQKNVAPFISYRLIQRLVMSSPSPAYVGRVSEVFTATNGDLKAVVTAILTDSEAMTNTSGKMAEPVLFATEVLRGLDVAVTGDATGVAGQSEAMGQKVLFPASVFSYFSPFYRVSVPGVFPPPVAPEFQAVNAETMFARVNYVFRAVNNQVSGNIKADFANWQDLAQDPAQLTEAVNQTFYGGLMTTDEKTAVMAGIAASKDPLTQVRNAVYVAAGAPQYQVQQ